MMFVMIIFTASMSHVSYFPESLLFTYLVFIVLKLGQSLYFVLNSGPVQFIAFAYSQVFRELLCCPVVPGSKCSSRHCSCAVQLVLTVTLPETDTAKKGSTHRLQDSVSPSLEPSLFQVNIQKPGGSSVASYADDRTRD